MLSVLLFVRPVVRLFIRRSISRVRFVVLALVGIAIALSTTLMSCENAAQTVAGLDDMPFVAVTQFIERPDLNAVRRGLHAALIEAGYREGENLRWEWKSAQGAPAAAIQIAKKYAWAKPDVIVAISTLSAQTVVSLAENIPVVFSAVTDPVEAKLVEVTDRPGNNVSGVSDRPPIDQHMALIREILPEAKRLGVIYDAEEDHWESLMALIHTQAQQQDFTEVKEMAIFSSAEVVEAARSLVGSVDAIYVPADIRLNLSLPAVVQVGQENDLPVFAGDTDGVKQGAIAGISFNYSDIGRQTADMVIRVLRGRNPEGLPVEFVKVVQLFVNPSAAEKMGVTLPAAVIERADEVIEQADEVVEQPE